VVARDMDLVYDTVVDAVDRQRVARIEMLDEFEEWHLLMQHYCLVYAALDHSVGAGDDPGELVSWLRDVGSVLDAARR
jgi:hypothetical protein